MNSDLELKVFLRSSLGVSPNAQFFPEPLFGDLHLDLQVNDPTRGHRFFLQVRSRASMEDIAFLNLVRDLHGTRHPEEGRAFIIAARSISPRLEKLAASLGLGVIRLPADMQGIAPSQTATLPAVHITSEKAWRVVCALLSKGRSSIRSIAISEKVSYGWAHGVIGTLLEQEIAIKDDGGVMIADVDKLLYSAAWERSLASMASKVVSVPELPVKALAPELTAMLEMSSADFAFTGTLAGSLLTSAVLPQKEIHLYLPRAHWALVEEFLGDGKVGNGFRLHLMEPDRDVFIGSLSREGVRITSSAQTLLDLAGMGSGSRDMARSMAVKMAGSLRADGDSDKPLSTERTGAQR